MSKPIAALCWNCEGVIDENMVHNCVYELNRKLKEIDRKLEIIVGLLTEIED